MCDVFEMNGTAKSNVQLPPLSCGEDISNAAEEDLFSIVDGWMNAFDDAVRQLDFERLFALIHHDAWIRDLLVLSWDFRSLCGKENIIQYFKKNLATSRLCDIRLRRSGAFQPKVKKTPGGEWIEAMFDFETKAGSGSGVVRLVGDAGNLQLFMIGFMLQNLKGFGEMTGVNRPMGGTDSLQDGMNWQERRDRQKEFLDGDPAVVVVGAGHSGLGIAARLGQLGVPTLIIDRNERIGDNWRNRYRTLVTHDPAQYAHMPYLPFPSTWPVFTPKDKLADWLEAYASIMELNVWMQTYVHSSSYDDSTKSWTISLQRHDGTIRTLHPRHIVLATGHSGEPRIPIIPSREQFQGLVYHASEHKDASLHPNIAGKKVVVIGSGTSSHDICQDYYENGADVTMVQRWGTCVLSTDKGVFMLHQGLYDEYGPSTEEADIYGQSMPFQVLFTLMPHLTRRIAEVDKDLLDGLTKAGFKLDFGPNEAGVLHKYFSRGGGYYLDVGCSQLIAESKIKVVQSEKGIRGVGENCVILADGRSAEADVVVLATGYDNMRTSARKIFGDGVADRLYDVWDFDEEGEINTMWRYSGHAGFWYMGGSLGLCRIYSLLLGLQIKACEEGIYVAPDRGRE